MKHRSNPPKEWLAARDIWMSVMTSKRSPDKILVRNIVRITYYIERVYCKKLVYSWNDLEENPGYIITRLLALIKLRVKSAKRAHLDTLYRYQERRNVTIAGMEVPERLRHLRTIYRKYRPRQQKVVEDLVEGTNLYDAGIETDLPHSPVFTGLRRSNAIRHDPVDVPRYVPRAERRVEPKVGDLCPKCQSPMGPVLAQSRTDRYEMRGDPYWDCYGMSQTGLYPPEFLEGMFGEIFTEHRRKLAQRRFDECHPVRCMENPIHSKVDYATS